MRKASLRGSPRELAHDFPSLYTAPVLVYGAILQGSAHRGAITTKHTMSYSHTIVFDRDGTLIEERHYLANPEGVCLLPGAAAALRVLRSMGFGLIVVTNQSGLARGIFDEATLARIHARLADQLAEEGAFLDGIFFCPHHPDEGCTCRKPEIGLLRQAQKFLGFDPSASYVIGDKACDVDLGRAAGMGTLLVRSGYGREEETGCGARADAVVDDLPAAVRWLSEAIDTRIPQSRRVSAPRYLARSGSGSYLAGSV